jgi:hypothetical protein
LRGGVLLFVIVVVEESDDSYATQGLNLLLPAARTERCAGKRELVLRLTNHGAILPRAAAGRQHPYLL